MTSVSPSTRQTIIETVKNIIRSGEGELSMSRIAKAAGISKSSLYYFFEDKNDLLASVVDSLFEECKLTAGKIAEESLPADEKLTLLIRMMMDLTKKESAITHFIFREVFTQNTLLLEKLFARREMKKLLFVKILREGQNSGVFRSFQPEETADILLAVLDFFILADAFPLPPESRSHNLPEYFLSLLRS